MAAEFHNLDLSCDSTSIVPFGANYTNSEYQSCAAGGSEPGKLFISGDAYMETNHGLYHHNIWRNFGIIILFTVAFIVISAWLTEIIEWSDGSGGGVTYSRKRHNRKVKSYDEENKLDEADHRAPPPQVTDSSANVTNAMGKHQLQKTESAFTWKSVKYTINASGSEKVLLNDVSGFCEPGQLTALVGSSGAGKSTCMLSRACLEDLGLTLLDSINYPNQASAHGNSSRRFDGRRSTYRSNVLSQNRILPANGCS